MMTKGSLQKKTEDLVNSALKVGGYLTWITVLNNKQQWNSEKGQGVWKKKMLEKATNYHGKQFNHY